MSGRHDKESSLGALCAVLVALFALCAPAARADVVSRGPAAKAAYASDSTRALTVGVPAGAVAGDVLVASLGFGSSGAKSQPSIVAPAGWTLVTRTNQSGVGALTVYVHVLAAGETAFTWTTSVTVGGTALVSAYGGVSATDPVDVSAGTTVGKGTSVATPTVSTTVANAMLVASYFGYRGNGSGTTWTPPSGMTELGEAFNSSGSRSGSVDAGSRAATGSTGRMTAQASDAQDYAIAVLTALRPGAPPSGPPVIGNVQAGSLTGTAATITWTTDQPSDSQVEYGPSASYGSSAALDPASVTGHSQHLTGLSPGTLYHYRVKSRNAAGELAVSDDRTFVTPTAGAVRLIVDTDIFSDADDVGALATAFGLQLKGEANVIAVGVNTRTSRPKVATNSWKCVAAVNAFYDSGSVPIGTALPNDGTALNSPDFIGPCARSVFAPVPESVVRVYRRTLAAQPDGSVVIASAGYLGNLSTLLSSAPDEFSALSGRDLVAAKVRTLVAMAGGYPSRSGENNLIGDPPSGQNVAANWPTKLVWSGYEVGDLVHTGQTIPSTHPADSPVRVAYGAFVNPGNWIYSYDLTAVYHAVRPDDPLLREVGPGTNTVTGTGGNTFRAGSGNQYYLALSDANALDAAIETLIATVPTTAPVISGVGAGSVTTIGATVSWTTDEPATTQVEYGPTTAYGSATALDDALVLSHGQALSGLTAGTLYHYRVKSRDAAGHLATSPDATFTTAPGGSGFAGPNDAFSSNTIDPAMWRVTQSGSTVAAANQQLEIRHPAGAWTKGIVSSTAYDQTGRAVQVQVKRAANNGLGGSSYGETSVFLRLDSTRYAYFFIASGTLTARVNKGAGETNLTPSWPRYSATAMQWLRFRESGGTLYFEYADAPGAWTVMASTPTPFAMTAVSFELTAGSNVTSGADVAQFDNVSS